MTQRNQRRLYAFCLLILFAMGIAAGAIAEDQWVIEFIDQEESAPQDIITMEEKPIYTITYQDCYGNTVHEERLLEGEAVMAPTLFPTKPGYQFMHWYVVGEETGAFVFGGGAWRDMMLAPYCVAETSQHEVVEYVEQTVPEVMNPEGILYIEEGVPQGEEILEIGIAEPKPVQDTPYLTVDDVLGTTPKPAEGKNHAEEAMRQQAIMAQILATTAPAPPVATMEQQAIVEQILGHVEPTVVPTAEPTAPPVSVPHLTVDEVLNIVPPIETPPVIEATPEPTALPETPDEIATLPDIQPSPTEDVPQGEAGIVTIAANVKDTVRVGDAIELTSALEGYTAIPSLVWQADAGDGWKDMGGAGLSYMFVLDEQNYQWAWRLITQAADGMAETVSNTVSVAQLATLETETAPEPTEMIEILPDPEPTVPVETLPEPEPTVEIETLPEIEPTVPAETLPEPEPTDVVDIEDEDIPKAGGGADVSGLSVNVTLRAQQDGTVITDGAPVYVGDTILLSGQLDNPGSLPYTLQWQCDRGDGWYDIQGANEMELSFPLTDENVDDSFRLLMIVADTPEEGSTP